MMRFMLLFSRQGKLQKWYLRELMQVVLERKPKMSSFLEWRDLKVVYKRRMRKCLLLFWNEVGGGS
uniref:AP complex mu/sigma subunit domain-containing protein n=1 Tax=Podarcis muralis TaxID=64176 RepID=A0A670I8L3_PODMU